MNVGVLSIETKKNNGPCFLNLDQLKIGIPMPKTTHRSKQSPKIAIVSSMCASEFKTTRLKLDPATESMRLRQQSPKIAN